MSWDSIKDIVGKAAPLVGTLIGGPAGATVGALVSKALGVAEDPKEVAKALMNPDKVADLQRWEYEHTERLEQIALDQLTVELQDTQNARSHHKKSGMPGVIVCGMTLMIAGLIVLLFFGSIPEGNRDIAYMLIGQISTLWGASIMYWVGTTKGSSDKNKWVKK